MEDFFPGLKEEIEREQRKESALASPEVISQISQMTTEEIDAYRGLTAPRILFEIQNQIEIEKEMLGDEPPPEPVKEERWGATKRQFQKIVDEGPQYDFWNTLKQEIATQMITPSSAGFPEVGDIEYGRPLQMLGEALDVNPKVLYKEATGKDYILPTTLISMVNQGKITELERREIIKQQSTFSDNVGRNWENIVRTVGSLFVEGVDEVTKFGKAVATGDKEKTLKILEKAGELGLTVADILGADALRLVYDPFNFMREDPIDFAAWLPGKVYTAAFKMPTPLLKGKGLKEAYQIASDFHVQHGTLGAVRGMASGALDKLPVPDLVKQSFADLYAGTGAGTKEARTKIRREAIAEEQLLEEGSLNQLREYARKEGKGNPEVEASLYYAMREGRELASESKKSAQLLRNPAIKEGFMVYRATGGEIPGNFKKYTDAIKRLAIHADELDAYQPKSMIWLYDGVPMTSSEFLFDLAVKNWDEAKISYQILPTATKAVKDNAEVLLNLKKTLFKLGSEQIGLRSADKPQLIVSTRWDMPEGKGASYSRSGEFFVEDMFRAIAPSYLPEPKLPGWKGIEAENYFDLFDASFSGTYEKGGRLVSDEAKYSSKISDIKKRKKAGHAVEDHFLDGLQLALPKLIDTIGRYKFYAWAKDNVASAIPVRGWKELSGKTQVRRVKKAGGSISRYGALEGSYVSPSLYRLIKSSEAHIDLFDGFLRNFAQTHNRLLKMLKHNKLVANFSTQAHNLYGYFMLMGLEGVPFHRLGTELKSYRKGLDDPSYRAFAETGQMPKSGARIGEMRDIHDSITKAKSPVQFLGMAFKEFEKAAEKEGFTKAFLSTLGTAGPEATLQTLEFLSYRVFGLNGKMAQFFTQSDRLVRYVFFKNRLQEQAKAAGIPYSQALKSPEMVANAAQRATDIMLDYGDLPLFIQGLRATGIAPYIAYPWRAAGYFVELPIRRPGSVLGAEALYEATLAQDTGLERLRRRGAQPGDFMVPISPETVGVASDISQMLGMPRYREMNVSPRYITPVPRLPHEPFGYEVDKWSEETLLGKTQPSYLEQRGPFKEEFGIPAPLPMHVVPPFELIRGEPKKAFEAFAPAYISKVQREKLYGIPIEKRDLISQAFIGLRNLNPEHITHGLKRDLSKVKKLKKKAKKLTYPERMRQEQRMLHELGKDR